MTATPPKFTSGDKSTTCANSNFTIEEIRKAIREETKEIINAVKTEIENVHAEVGRVVDRLKAIETTLSTVQSTQQRQQDEIDGLKEAIRKQENLNCDDMVSEIESRISRGSNLIVRGLPEPVGSSLTQVRELDADSFSGVLELLGVKTESKYDLTRIGKLRRDDRPRLLKIKFNAISDRNLVLSKSKFLRGTKCKDVYIDQDLTPMQQKERQVLLAELKARRSAKEDVVIRRNKVVLRNDTTNLGKSTNFRFRF
jgi:predicted DNA-binding protein YlxM (UPF0122 family)